MIRRPASELSASRLRPQTGILLLLLALLTINGHPRLWGPGGVALALLGLILIVGARLSVRRLLVRTLQLAPFLIMIGLVLPWSALESVAGWNLLARVLLSGLALVIYGLTSDLQQLSVGLSRLRLPKPLLVILNLMQLFLSTLTSEARRLETSRNLRFFGRKYLRQFRVGGRIVGSLCLRAYERGERLAAAMACRGWSGLPPQRAATMKLRDWLALGLGSSLALLLLVGVK